MRKVWLSYGALAVLAAQVATPAVAQIIKPNERAQAIKQHPQLIAQFGGAITGPIATYVSTVGAKVATAAGLKDQCTFTVINSDVVNAFAVPGCYIYITRGLMAIMNSEDELASVLGHEVGHIVGKHSLKRTQASTLSTLGAIALGIATKSEEIMQTAGQLAQVYTLSYSRKQENESDDYGVRYLQANGYNLYAASDMLAALAAQEALDAKVKNRQSRDVPTWARSHPITAERVARTANAAQAAKASRDVPPEQVRPYLTALSGMRVGDDPDQGFVDGRRFSHPSMKITFEVPQGFSLNNTTEAVEIEGPNSLKGRFGGGVPLTGTLDAYAIAKVRETLGQTPATLGIATPGTTNGMPTITLLARAQTRTGRVDVGVIAYNLNGRAFHFVMIGPADGLSPTFPITQAFRELSATEIAALRPRELEIVTVRAGDTVASLSARMAYPDFKTERFLMINGMRAERPLKPGELLKIVRFSGTSR